MTKGFSVLRVLWISPTALLRALGLLVGLTGFSANAQPGAITRVSTHSAGAQANGNSNRPAISADGRFVAFDSQASNLVGGDSNRKSDVFVQGHR
jgi:hypothetical protein